MIEFNMLVFIYKSHLDLRTSELATSLGLKDSVLYLPDEQVKFFGKISGEIQITEYHKRWFNFKFS